MASLQPSVQFHVSAVRRDGDSSMPNIFQASDVTMNEYHTLSENALSELLLFFEDLIELEGNAEGSWEVDYSSGVLTVNFGKEHGVYVLNKQPPNKQIWLSSPISGPKRYDYDASKGSWFYHRDQKTLGTLLRNEVARILGREPEHINFPIA